MADFGFRRESIEELYNFPVLVSRHEDQSEQRRLSSEKRLIGFRIKSPVLTKLQMTQYRDFFIARYGCFDTFTFTNPFDDRLYYVRFTEDSFRTTFSGGVYQCEFDLVVTDLEENTIVLWRQEVSAYADLNHVAWATSVFGVVNASSISKAADRLRIDLKCSAPANLDSVSSRLWLASPSPSAGWWYLDDMTNISAVDVAGKSITTSWQTFVLPLSVFSVNGTINQADIRMVEWYNSIITAGCRIYWRDAMFEVA